ncbi:MAG: hypothetical protein A2Z34_11145 [Planctomycetes bacterium RBG_16_59_8]|nr:MAG: hypothetical protein A2Z34_11145 [Planctomycetes bacterium RBG_16_59_8]
MFAKRAEREFDRLARSDRSLGKRLATAIERIAADPDSGELLTGDFKGYRKRRVGDYRIIYRVEHARLIIYIIAVDHRSDVYR